MHAQSPLFIVKNKDGKFGNLKNRYLEDLVKRFCPCVNTMSNIDMSVHGVCENFENHKFMMDDVINAITILQKKVS